MRTNNTASRPRHRGVRIASIALLAALVPALLPAPSQALGTLKLTMANASALVTFAERNFEIRVGVQSTCSPVLGTHIGSCSDIALSVTWWSGATPPKTETRSLSWLGGVGVVRVSAQDVHQPSLHYRATATQTWQPVTCGQPAVPQCIRQSVRAQNVGRTVVLAPIAT